MDKAKTEKYRERLTKAKAEILKELEVEQEFFVHNDQGDLVDIADGVISNEVLNKLSDMDVEKVKLIDLALEKIDKGTYGVCEGTGKHIPEARLNAIPWAQYTVEYAQQLEKQRKQQAEREGAR
ncbi:MAG: TraR/DksA family transcriptional regulator [Spirochaetia bacterium]|nr:TraR/DksA family transcriptional regulator [Spirochaetia bacterium]